MSSVAALIAAREREFDAAPGLGARLAALARQPYFRAASPSEVDESHAAYVRGDIPGLLDTWQRVAAPTRATMPSALRWAYAQAGRGPAMVNAMVFLITVRAVLRAGERFRDTLPPALREAIHTQFPWLEHRHEHIPEGFTPSFAFPTAFREFLEQGSLDEGLARWQLAVALNEVQQHAYSSFAALHFRLPELERHAARERAMALDYFRHWSPRCTRALWHETIAVLDSLNAAVFELVCRPHGVFAIAMRDALFGRREWAAFVRGLDEPHWRLA